MSEKIGYPVNYEALYVEKSSRAELFIRIVYSIILAIILYVWFYLVGFAIIAQWFHVLIFGKRSERLWRFKTSFFRFYTRAFAYYSIITDVRPPISGKPIPLTEVSKPPAPTGFCINCGEKLRPGDDNCRKCGQRISQT